MVLNRDRIFKAADKYIQSGKIEKALAEFEKWVAANPKDWNTIRQIGDLYARIGRNEEAIKRYAQIADYYRQDGFNVRAIATHKMILRLDPQNETAMLNLAELQVIQGLLMEAKAQYQALVELYTKTGHKRQATEVFKKLAEIDPSDLKVRYKFAEFLERAGKVEEAVAEYVGIADEFINKGLVAEAIQIMEKVHALEGVAELDKVESVLSGPAGIEGEYVDLASELSDEVFGTQSAVEEVSSSGSPIDAVTNQGLDVMFREFKKGVEKQLGTEDYDTRYNLGIAYMEMGLLDEAIAEFQLASKDQGWLLECCSMLGLCFLEKGMPQIAIKWFEKGINSPGRSEEKQHGLRYDLATAYELAGEPDRALELYMDIYRVNACFRDVKDRVSGLQAAKN